MYDLLVRATPYVRAFAQEALGVLGSADPWIDYVVPSLTFDQQRVIRERGVSGIDGLDMAALLRVLDRNWYALSGRLNLPREMRNHLKEVQLIRNRWAHEHGAEVLVEDRWRDLDTIGRFMCEVGAPDDFVARIRSEKASLFNVAPEQSSPTEQRMTTSDARKAAERAETKFALASLVVPVSNPNAVGPVIEIVLGAEEPRYVVFLDGRKQSFYESQLALAASKATALEIDKNRLDTGMTALQLLHPGLQALYSLHAARVDYVPYQFRPVIRFIRSDRPRMLIADDVGVGKTIEAGLILRELQSRQDIRSVLVICPKPLVTERKWQHELRRFDEHFEQLDGPALRYCLEETRLDGEWPEKYRKAILPFSLFTEGHLVGSERRNGKHLPGLLDLDPPPQFDLVIVDEAHHIRNRSTLAYEGVRFFLENASAAILMTATPIQLGTKDLFVLLNLLRPDLVVDKPTFDFMSDPNPAVNRAAEIARAASGDWQQKALECMHEAAMTDWGQRVLGADPAFQAVFDALSEPHISHEKRVKLTYSIEQLHSFSGLINRTRRRDIGEFTTRTPRTIAVDFTEEQQALHDDLLAAQATIMTALHDERSVAFLMSTIRRQAASCLFGLAPLVRDILTRRLDEIDLSELDEAGNGDISDAAALGIQEQIDAVLHRASQLSEVDPKLDKLLEIIADKQQLENKKVLVFSCFRHTLAYLASAMKRQGARYGLITGSTLDEDRVGLRNRFGMPADDPAALDVLLSSEVGCEGLDYQFCDCMVNYDLPWNPMRVEQRIGRIDRYGQKSEKVLIYNFVTPGTVDYEIYDRCLLRIGIFNSYLGASEEILGEIASELRRVAEDLRLTEAERDLRLQQLSDNSVRRVQEQIDLEQKQAELVGLRVPSEQFKEDIENHSSFWLAPDSLRRLVREYLGSKTSAGQSSLLGEGPVHTLRLRQEEREALLQDARNLPGARTPVFRHWERWLSGADPNYRLTFDSAAAEADREAALVTPVHPLARQAALQLLFDTPVTTRLRVKASDVAPGQYPFAVYRWERTGLTTDSEFVAVAQSPEVEGHLFEFLESAQNAGDLILPSESLLTQLDAEHHLRWKAAVAEHRLFVDQQTRFKVESINASHRASTALLSEALEKAREDRIIRMRRSQIANAEAGLERRVAELEAAASRADINAELVAYGVLHVDAGR